MLNGRAEIEKQLFRKEHRIDDSFDGEHRQRMEIDSIRIIEGKQQQESMSEWKIGNCCHSNYWVRNTLLIRTFFDKVMVMVEDEAIRNNRLALLGGIGKLFLRIAEFSKLT